MPSFFAAPPLPSAAWVDVTTRRLKEDVLASLSAPIVGAALVPASGATGKGASRAVVASTTHRASSTCRSTHARGPCALPREHRRPAREAWCARAHRVVRGAGFQASRIEPGARAARAAAAQVAKTFQGCSVHRAASRMVRLPRRRLRPMSSPSRRFWVTRRHCQRAAWRRLITSTSPARRPRRSHCRPPRTKGRCT